MRCSALDADEARKLYDPNGDQTLDELKQQVFADKTMTEPARYLADMVARGGQPVWLYRFSYVAEALRSNPAWKGTLHGFEIPYTFDLPAAVVKDKVTAADKTMARAGERLLGLVRQDRRPERRRAARNGRATNRASTRSSTSPMTGVRSQGAARS